jgi:carboxyl-terminal processing protease
MRNATPRDTATRVWTPILVVAFLSHALAWQPISAIANSSADDDERDIPSTNPDVAPLAIFHKAWSVVKESYHDPTFNSQDWSRWEHKYDRQIKNHRDAHKAIETMLASLGDRYTRGLPRSAFDDVRSCPPSIPAGIGVQIGVDKIGRIIVLAPTPGMPAAKAGLRPADAIVEVDGNPIRGGMSVDEVSKQIRGLRGTPVTVTIERHHHRKRFDLIRDTIVSRSVTTDMMLNNDVGYLRIGDFISHKMHDHAREALDRLRDAHGIIIDLRTNPGGLLSNAIDISSLFLEEGIVSYSLERDGKQTAAPANGKPISSQPIVILVNDRTASAAEITAAALRDHGRASIVGQRTYGKGLIQGITRLADGSGMNVTIARYLSPAGHEIRDGIRPDYEICISPDDQESGKGSWYDYGPDEETGAVRTPKDGKDVLLAKAIEVLQAKLNAPAPKCIVQGHIERNQQRSFLSGLHAEASSLFSSVFRSTRRFIFDLFDDFVT